MVYRGKCVDCKLRARGLCDGRTMKFQVVGKCPARKGAKRG